MTARGYTTEEQGRLNNFAVEPKMIRGREGRHRPPLPFRTVREIFTSHGS
ncbi:hypothetical protein MiTs_03239 [Microcystis aeruginosa NIES-2521]|uniref:Uncharacterized protein n=1 Tax=Microcystis aeruginosa NIES-2521 TaxID=2303983 RepID=A0A5A5RXI5_MICAE|nr:hypothetical protein MiTs_03239 [Microcystis aeruginosa NIES-2521]